MHPNVTYILGAGFSKAVNESMPTANELLSLLRDETKRKIIEAGYEDFLNRKDVEGLLSIFFNDYPWLEKEQIHIARALYYAVVRDIFDILQGEKRKVYPPSVHLDTLASKWIEMKSSIVTFNYDVLAERIILDFAKKQKSEIKFFNHLWRLPIRSVGHRFTGTILGGATHEESAPLVIKLHGGINWLHSGDFDDPNEEIYEGDWKKDSPATSDLFPLIIPPTIEKTSFYRHRLTRLCWRRAKAVISLASTVVFIGYSLPASDAPVRLLLSSCLKKKNVVVVNTDTSSLFADRMKEFFDGIGSNLDMTYVQENALQDFVQKCLPGLSKEYS